MTDVPARLQDEDGEARERALDVARSFLVQAPAGSGKTGLLIQRYLALLAQVDRPERIVAMTFTRKAAGEMRERIAAALRAAERDDPVGDAPHDQRTRSLALAALEQDRRHGWQLVAHPARLAIVTIDALATGLARHAPVTTRLGPAPRYVDDATALHAEAARAALVAAPPDDPAWRRFLDHLDNDATGAVAFLAALLGKRDQWLRELMRGSPGDLRVALDETLAAEIAGELGRACAAFADVASSLVPHLRHAAGNLDAEPAGGECAASLRRCAGAGGVPSAAPASLADWQTLAGWLLVANDARFRKSIDKTGGFPAVSKGAGAAERRAAKDAIEGVLESLAADPALAAALHSVRGLPPSRCDDAAWAIVDALLAVLPRVAAQLTLTFIDAGTVDFAQGSIAALAALGQPDEPSDLLLRLDLALAHLLVDEFQDTSFTQLELIARLTAGWMPGDGRTLFAVGDPMQSIYRFREAEVRLFVEAQENGSVAGIPVECLKLRRNFRAQSGLVEWVNATFPTVLGSRSDPWRSAVAFAEAAPTRPALGGPAATLDIAGDTSAEARLVVAHIERALARGDAKIAVLVRARTHLDTLLPALRNAGIAFAAVDLDTLTERRAVQDLVALTHALVQPADRLALLAVLRAPWCGLALADLLAVAGTDPLFTRTVLPALVAPADVPDLTADGWARLERMASVIAPSIAARGHASLAARVRGAWLALGGPACLDDEADLDAAERYFALLAAHEVAGDIVDWAAFVDALGPLRAEATPSAQVRVQVMTLHRAKGLEFDTVIMPGLARGRHRSDPELLRWRRRPQGLIVAPGKARGGEPGPVYAYLAALAADEEDAELSRLLYVGCTRAKNRLHLTAALAVAADSDGAIQWKRPARGSALAKLWPVVAVSVASPQPVAAAASPVAGAMMPLMRLPLGWTVPAPRPAVPVVAFAAAPPREPLPFDWARETARHVGTVAHRLLAQIARDGLAAWSDVRIGALAPRIAAALAGEGVESAEQDGAVARVQAAIRATLADPRGRWLFDPAHEGAFSEWALAGVDGDAIVHRTLDRTFVADGVRWIVDFKTGSHEGSDVETFLDRERERYAPTLESYARLVRALDARPIRLALYHPQVGGWREWAHEG